MLNPLIKGIGGGNRTLLPRGSLKDIVSSCVMDLDVTLSASADSGQRWRNLVQTPADGSAQSAYDVSLGASSGASTDDPTFNGTVGAKNAYWAFDGGDFFQIPANTTFLNSLHKTTGGQAFWVACAFRYKDTASGTNPAIFATSGAGIVGISLRLTGSLDKPQISQRGETALVDSTSGSLPLLVDGQDYVIIVSVPAGGGNVKWYINSVTPVTETITYNAATANAGFPMRLAHNNAVASFPNGSRMYAFAMGNAVLSDPEAAAIIGEYEKRHILDYTP